ncbi:MAG: glycogen/starch/alpha-glucan phosphorylase, partial [Clostridia bacterium]
SSTEYYFKNPKLRIIVEELNNGFAGESFTNISNYLLRSNQVADPYMCFADFADYMKTYDRIDKTYADTRRWNKMSLVNIAESGRFSADRAIKEYATRIWNLDRND